MSTAYKYNYADLRLGMRPNLSAKTLIFAFLN